MIRRTTKLIFESIVIALASLVAFVVVAGWRLSEGPIPLDFATPHIVEALTPEDGAFDVEFDRTVVIWQGDRRSVEVHAVGVRAVNEQGDVIGTVPEISISFSAAALFRGMVAPTRLIIMRPKLRLVRPENGRIVLGIEPGEQPSETAGEDALPAEIFAVLGRDLLAPRDPERPMGYLKEVRISHADLVIDDRHLGISWRAPNADILLAKDVVGLRAEAWLGLDIQGRDAQINMVGIYNNEEDRFDLAAGFRGIEPSVVAGGLPELAALKAVELPVAGNVMLSMQGSGEIGNIELSLEGGSGWIRTGSGLVPDLEVRALRGEATVSDDLGKVTFEGLHLALVDGPDIRLSGEAGLAGGDEFHATLTVEKVPIEEVPRYWPAAVAPSTRSWILENVTEGALSEVDIEIKGRTGPGGIDAPGDVEITALSGALLLDDLTVSYLSGLPPVQRLVGGGTFDRGGFHLTISGGEVDGLTVKQSKVAITGLDEEDQNATISVNLEGKVRKALEILDRERLGYPAALGIDPRDIDGKANIEATFTFPLLQDLEMEDVAFGAEADMRDVHWRATLLNRDLEKSRLKLKVDPERMVIRGTGDYAEMPLSFRWVENFHDEGRLRRRVTIKAEPTIDNVAQFGVDLRDHMAGEFPVELVYAVTVKNRSTVKVDVDLQKAELQLPALNWRKELGEPGSAKVSLILKDNQITEFKDAQLEAAGLTAAGSAQFGPKTGKLVGASMTKLALGVTDMAGTLRLNEDGWYDLDVTGTGLDISGLLEPGNATEKPQFPAMRAKIAIKRLYARPGRYLEDARLHVSYDGDDWRSISFTGKPAFRTNDAKTAEISVDLTPKGDRRILKIHAGDAGGVIWTFGVSDNVIGGKLDVTGSIDDSRPKQPLEATIVMTDYTVVEAPVLAQMLTMASLTGIGNVLSGNGISFSRLEVPVQKSGDFVRVKDARAYGSELGFTLNGDLDLAARKVDLGGTIVPAYTINSLLGYIPVLGQLLVGEKGSGIFAAKYSIDGSLDGPNITVNPVATLTPGFLRGIFGVPGGLSDHVEEGEWADAEVPPQDIAPAAGDSGLRN